MYLLRDIKFTGYVGNHFNSLTFVKQKSTLQIKQKKSNFDIDKTFRALKIIAWLFSAHHMGKRLNADYTFHFKIKLKGFQIYSRNIAAQCL